MTTPAIVGAPTATKAKAENQNLVFITGLKRAFVSQRTGLAIEIPTSSRASLHSTYQFVRTITSLLLPFREKTRRDSRQKVSILPRDSTRLGFSKGTSLDTVFSCFVVLASPFHLPSAAIGITSLSEPFETLFSAEAFEICEYGRKPDKEELKQLFPFFGA